MTETEEQQASTPTESAPASDAAAQNGLDFPITTRALMRFAAPTMMSNILMNLFMMVDDSLFVANLIGTDGLSALNICMPVLMAVMAIASMVAVGGSALVAKLLGEGKSLKARDAFTFLLLFGLAVSTAICIVGLIFHEPILYLIGADEALYPLCEAYAIPMFLLLPAAMAGAVYQSFLVTAGEPDLSFKLTVAGGVLNILFDWLFIACLGLGMTGSAMATASGYILQSIVGTVYFACKKESPLHFARPHWSTPVLAKALSNGLGDMLLTLSSSVTTMAMNIILMNISGSDAVAACTIVLEIQTILSSAYMGYVMGCMPLISYNYGAKRVEQLQRITRAMLSTIAALAAATVVLVLLLTRPIAPIYGNGNEEVIAMAVAGAYAFIPGFVLMGFNHYASSLFAALNNGFLSAFNSFMRLFVFLIVPLLVLPSFLGVWGVWVSLPLSEALGIVLSAYLFLKYRSVYQYA